MIIGSAVVDLTAAEPVFCVFGAKMLRTFWGKCTEQSRRKKLAEGGFEPRDTRSEGKKFVSGAELARLNLVI